VDVRIGARRAQLDKATSMITVRTSHSHVELVATVTHAS